MKPLRPRKPTQLQQGILYAAAGLARYIVQVEDVAALLRRQGLSDADCSDIDERTKNNYGCCAMILACLCAASTESTEKYTKVFRPASTTLKPVEMSNQ